MLLIRGANNRRDLMGSKVIADGSLESASDVRILIPMSRPHISHVSEGLRISVRLVSLEQVSTCVFAL